MALTLSTYFDDVQETLSDALEARRNVGFSSFSNDIVSQGTVITYGITPASDGDNDRANLLLDMEYEAYYLKSSEEAGTSKIAMQLLVLNPEGDTEWTLNMRNRVWNGRYPSTIAINIASGEAYLLFVEASYIELKFFVVISLTDLELFKASMDARKPFSIHVEPEALFKVLDGREGTHHLLDNLFISLFGSKMFKISRI